MEILEFHLRLDRLICREKGFTFQSPEIVYSQNPVKIHFTKSGALSLYIDI